MAQNKQVVKNVVKTNVWSTRGDGTQVMTDGEFLYLKVRLDGNFGVSKPDEKTGVSKFTRVANNTGYWDDELPGGLEGKWYFGKRIAPKAETKSPAPAPASTGGFEIDYDKLAAAMLKASKK